MLIKLKILQYKSASFTVGGMETNGPVPLAEIVLLNVNEEGPEKTKSFCFDWGLRAKCHTKQSPKININRACSWYVGVCAFCKSLEGQEATSSMKMVRMRAEEEFERR